MKKIKLLLLVLLFIVIPVKAENIEYYLSSQSIGYNHYDANNGPTVNFKRGDYVYVTMVVDGSSNEYTLSSGKATIRYDNTVLELVKYDDGKIYSLDNSDFNTISNIATNSGNRYITISYKLNEKITSSRKKLLDVKFRVLASASVGVTKIYEMDGGDNLTCQNDNNAIINCADSLYSEVKVNVLPSDVNTLSSLKVDGIEVPNFSENTNTYNIVVDSNKENINIEATKKDSRASVSGDLGTKKISYGTNTFQITVTSESKKSNTYVLNINRPDLRSKINTLKTLKLSVGNISFKPEINEYNVTVKNEVEKITITSQLTDDKAKYEEDYTKKEVTLMEGVNKIQIKVIAENEDVNIYTVNITRELSGNNTLKELKVNDEKIILEKNKFDYELEVENEIDKVSIMAIPTNDNSNVSIEKINNLVVGDNDISITVTAPNGNEVAYHLKVVRKEIISNNSKVSNIEITGYRLNFQKDKYYYDLKIKNEEELDIKVSTEDNKATVKIEGNKNLINGSVIKVNVIAEDKTVTRYFINIEKKVKSNMMLIIIIILVLFIMALTLIIIALGKKRRKMNKQIKELDKKDDENKNQEQVLESDTEENKTEEDKPLEKRDVEIKHDEE